MDGGGWGLSVGYMSVEEATGKTMRVREHGWSYYNAAAGTGWVDGTILIGVCGRCCQKTVSATLALVSFYIRYPKINPDSHSNLPSPVLVSSPL